MKRSASILVPLVSVAALTAGAAHAGDYYERVGANRYKPAEAATFSSTCCYKKITKHITIAKTVWVKVAPPKPHRRDEDDDDAADQATDRDHGGKRPAQVVELGEVIHHGDKCRKAVPVRERGVTIVVMVNVRCR